MLFRRKGWLRNQYDHLLVEKLVLMKNEWSRQKQLIERSVEPSPEVLFELKVVEAKYLYLLKEAKFRNVKINR